MLNPRTVTIEFTSQQLTDAEREERYAVCVVAFPPNGRSADYRRVTMSPIEAVKLLDAMSVGGKTTLILSEENQDGNQS